MSIVTHHAPPESGTESPEAKKTPDELLDPLRRRHDLPDRTTGGNVAAYVLIMLGVLFLIGTMVPLGGSIFLLGLGAAFIIARLTTNRYGFAVPAALLTGLGIFVALRDAGVLPGDEGTWALICLGLSFAAIYPLGGRPRSYWPLIPGAILTTLGLAQLDAVALAPLAAYAWVGRYWGAVLVLIGLWVLARDSLAPSTRQVVGAILVAALILGGVLFLATVTAVSVSPFTGRVGFPGTIGDPLSTIGQTTTLTAPVGPAQALRITNSTGGSTRVVPGDAGQIRARVTRQAGFGPPAVVNLAPSNDGVSLDGGGLGTWPNQSPAVSFVVEAPRDVSISVQASSGDVVVEDRAAAVQIEGSSGSLSVSRIDGPATLRTSSGSIRAADVSDEFDAITSSGSIDASGLRHPRNAQTSSGSIALSGTFGDIARIQTSSGGVSLGLAPDSSTRISATTSSGNISTGSLLLTSTSVARNSFGGSLGSGTGTLTINTSSGSIQLDVLR